MQLGVTPIVSVAGGLPEYQPAGFPPGDVDDVGGLAAAFDKLADPTTAAQQGAAAARHDANNYSVDCFAERFLNVLTEVLAVPALTAESA